MDSKTNHFRLFPPRSPEIRPFREGKKPSLSAKSASASTPLDDLKNNKTDALLSRIRDETHIQIPPKAHTKSKSDTTSKTKLHETSTTRQNVKRPRQWTSPNSSITFVNDNSRPSSPSDIPMRSTFPRYNPNLPLNQQEYYPQLSNRHSRRHQKPNGLCLPPEPEIDRALGPKTVPASVMNFPLGILESVEVQYSSAVELQGLWEAANGQRPEDLSRCLNLRLTRYI